MQRSLLASLIIMSLSACDSDSMVVNSVDDVLDNIVSDISDVDTETTNGNEAMDTGNDNDVTDNDTDNDASATDDTPATPVVVVQSGNDDDHNNSDQSSSNSNQISDDAGSSTSDGGEQGSDSSAADNGGSDNDAAQNTDDSGSATSDGGQNTDDSGSSTSDGGQNTDDSGSSSSDGGENTNQDNTQNNQQDTNTDNNGRNTDAGDFASDNIGGNVIRSSSLVSVAQQNICTTVANRDDYSNTWVGDFILHNNAWRPWRVFPGYEWEQCIYTNTNGALAGWNYDWGPGRTGINGNPNPSGDFYVRSYPELIFGVKDEFRTSAPKATTGLPVKISDMPNISINYSYDGPQYGESRTVDASNNARFPNGTTISGERNVAIEAFFYEDPTGQCSENIVKRSGGSNHTYEVMVWLDAGAERLPAGPGDFVADLKIRGDDYKVYTKGSDNRYIAFVAQNPTLTGTLYWNDFVDWAQDNAHQVQQRYGARSNSVQIQDDWCMANIIVGTEIFWGAGNIDFYDWTITQSR